MNWNSLACLIFMCIKLSYAHNGPLTVNRIIEIIKRRNLGRSPILGIPRDPEDLPEAESIHPGHTLIRPSMSMLKSAVKFPHKDIDGHRVYGNLNNLGITYGKQRERILYTNFRKANNLLMILQGLTKNYNSRSKRKPVLVLVITNRQSIYGKPRMDSGLKQISEEENNANEIIDDIDAIFDNSLNFRKSSSKSKHRKRKREYSSDSNSDRDDSSDSADYEKNPGNPFTIHKNRYKQNWLWNLKMDGDHMNLNPFAAEFINKGPSGANLFFGRKWWYYNQDDYLPLR